jgi:HTH-type transcriptional regulator/antitoxin HigA
MRITGPLKTPAEYQAALAEIDRLMDAAEGSPAADRLEVLSILVEAYENQNYPIEPPHPVEAIKFRMDQAGMTRRELEPYIGSRARVAEVLNQKRPLSLTMIRRLNTGLGIPLDSLIQPYPLKSKERKNVVNTRRGIRTKSPNKHERSVR